jgi:hypothetical protein
MAVAREPKIEGERRQIVGVGQLDQGPRDAEAREVLVSLVSPRRTFARVQATTRTRVDLGLRLAAVPVGRLRPSRIHATMPVQVSLSSPQEVDDDLHCLLQRAFDENC